MPMTDHKKIALLIDAENTAAKYMELVFDELRAYGFATYKRVYGKAEVLTAWKDVVFKYAMTPIMQFNYTNGKNASDSALIIDAMDILYTGNVDGFCLVTSDSDFTKLAIRLREAGMFVMGMGEQKTPESLMRACEEFKYLDMLYKDNYIDDSPEQPQKSTQKTSRTDSTRSDNRLPSEDELKKEIARILAKVFEGTDWVKLGDLANALPKNIPGFNVKFYGCSKLKQLMKKFGDRFEMREMSEENSVPYLYVRDKQ